MFSRFFKVDGLETAEFLEKHIKNFSTDHPGIRNVNLREIFRDYEDDEELTLHQQFMLLSCCPNFHNWMARKNHGVKRTEYFLPHGKSPRNQLMSNVLFSSSLQHEFNELLAVNNHMKVILKHVLNDVYHVSSLPTRKASVKKVYQFILCYCFV